MTAAPGIPKKIFICAADVSSEMHLAQALAHLLPTLRQQNISPEFFGIAGDKTAALLEEQKIPLELMAHTKDFMVGGGPLDVIAKLPLRKRIEKQLEKKLHGHEKSSRPVYGAILVDNGEINLRLSGLLHFFRVPVVYYIPPKIWVWRKKRIESLVHHVSVVLSILPFEKNIYDEYKMPFVYVGNPLVDEVDLSSTESAVVKVIPAGKICVTLMPGSRHGEIRFHTPLFIETVRKFLALQANPQEIVFLLPVPAALDKDAVARPFLDAFGQQVLAFSGGSHECLKASRIALIKSGTSTLEAGFLGVPMVITYQSGVISRLMFHHVLRYRRAVGLVNLFHGFDAPPICPEFILEKAQPNILAEAMNEIFREGPIRATQLQKLSRTRELLRAGISGFSPSRNVAIISDVIFKKRLLPEDDVSLALVPFIEAAPPNQSGA